MIKQQANLSNKKWDKTIKGLIKKKLLRLKRLIMN